MKFNQLYSVPKLTLLTLILFSSFLNLSAQTGYEEDTFRFNADVSFYTTTQKQKQEKELYFMISGYCLYHITSNIAIGPSIQYEYLITPEFRVVNKRWEKSTFGIGPVVRYYPISQGRVLPFITSGIYYSLIKYHVTNDRTRGHEYSFGFGTDIFLTDNITLELALEYKKHFDMVKENKNKHKFFTPGEYDYSKFQFKVGFGVALY